VQSLAFAVLRQLGTAEALRRQLARKAPPPAVDALLCTALALASDPAAPYEAFTLVDQAVEAAKRQPPTRNQAAFVNGCLRRYLRERDALHASIAQDLQAVWNHPLWWIRRLQKDHPDQWQQILAANNARAPLVLRINERKTSRAQYQQSLRAMNLEAIEVGEQGLQLAKPFAVTELPGYREGWFSVQDSAAQMAAPLLLGGLAAADRPLRVLDEGRSDAPMPLRVLDACAAPGGKTAHLLELADCEVTALDIDAARCGRIHENLARLGLTARVLVADAGKPQDWWPAKCASQPFDAILLDAPCTASGIVRRHPDVRWLRRETDIAQLAAVQARLLAALWPLLRAGGRLLYCTCSVFRAEGDTQIQTFLAHHTDAALRPSPGHLVPQSGAPGGKLPDNPVCDNDGFFYALLEKRPH
jgi:16S rRNA (cytosine967-C5)-methyltransferase